MILWGVLSPLSSWSWSASLSTVYILLWQFCTCIQIVSGATACRILTQQRDYRTRERGSVWSGITECKIAETLASAETCRIWLISQKTSAIKELATVGRPEYTPFSVYRIESLFNLSLRMKRRQRRRKAKTLPVWSSSSRELQDLRLHWGHDLT